MQHFLNILGLALISGLLSFALASCKYTKKSEYNGEWGFNPEMTPVKVGFCGLMSLSIFFLFI